MDVFDYATRNFNLSTPVQNQQQYAAPVQPVQNVQPAVVEAPVPAPVNGGFFCSLPNNETEAYAYCKRIATSMFVPKAYAPETFLPKILEVVKDEKKAREMALEKSIGNIFVCCQYAFAVGITNPLQALQGIGVINGVPCIYGDLLYALCKSRAKVQVTEVWDENRKEAYCRVERAGYQPVEHTFGYNDAIIAGLMVLDKQGFARGNKAGPWTQFPKRMCQMRARSFALRDQCPDVLKGLSVYEEIIDITDIQPAPEEAAPVEKRKRRTKAEMAAALSQQTNENAAIPQQPVNVVQPETVDVQTVPEYARNQPDMPPPSELPPDSHADDMFSKYGDM